MGKPTWGFLTNHAYVLRCLALFPQLTLREVAERIEITERAVQRIVSELEQEGYLARERVGRNNRYTLREGLPRRALDPTMPLKELLGLADDSPHIRGPAGIARNQSFID